MIGHEMVFNIQDPNNDVPEEIRNRIEDLAAKILSEVDNVAQDPFEALQALSAVVAYVLSEGFVNRRSADQALSAVALVISSTIERAEKDGNTMWSQRVTH